jgi:hypothetical protein
VVDSEFFVGLVHAGLLFIFYFNGLNILFSTSNIEHRTLNTDIALLCHLYSYEF